MVGSSCIEMEYAYKQLVYLGLNYQEIVKLITTDIFKADYIEIVLKNAFSENIFKISSVDGVGIYALKSL